MTTTASPATSTAGSTDTPQRRTLLVLATVYLVGFVAAMATSQTPDDVVDPQKVIDQMTRSENATAWICFGGVALAATLLFYAAGLRSLLSAAKKHWTTEAAGYGFLAMATALVMFVAADLWLAKAVDLGDLSAVHTLTIIDTSTFLFAMLGLCGSMLGTGLAGRATGALPSWVCWASIVLGAIAPIGPGGFAPFLLFPIWLIVVAATVKVDTRA